MNSSKTLKAILLFFLSAALFPACSGMIKQEVNLDSLTTGIVHHPKCPFKSRYGELFVLLDKKDLTFITYLLNNQLFEESDRRYPDKHILLIKTLLFFMAGSPEHYSLEKLNARATECLTALNDGDTGTIRQLQEIDTYFAGGNFYLDHRGGTRKPIEFEEFIFDVAASCSHDWSMLADPINLSKMLAPMEAPRIMLLRSGMRLCKELKTIMLRRLWDMYHFYYHGTKDSFTAKLKSHITHLEEIEVRRFVIQQTSHPLTFPSEHYQCKNRHEEGLIEHLSNLSDEALEFIFFLGVQPIFSPKLVEGLLLKTALIFPQTRNHERTDRGLLRKAVMLRLLCNKPQQQRDFYVNCFEQYAQYLYHTLRKEGNPNVELNADIEISLSATEKEFLLNLLSTYHALGFCRIVNKDDEERIKRVRKESSDSVSTVPAATSSAKIPDVTPAFELLSPLITTPELAEQFEFLAHCTPHDTLKALLVMTLSDLASLKSQNARLESEIKNCEDSLGSLNAADEIFAQAQRLAREKQKLQITSQALVLYSSRAPQEQPGQLDALVRERDNLSARLHENEQQCAQLHQALQKAQEKCALVENELRTSATEWQTKSAQQEQALGQATKTTADVRQQAHNDLVRLKLDFEMKAAQQEQAVEQATKVTADVRQQAHNDLVRLTLDFEMKAAQQEQAVEQATKVTADVRQQAQSDVSRVKQDFEAKAAQQSGNISRLEAQLSASNASITELRAKIALLETEKSKLADEISEWDGKFCTVNRKFSEGARLVSSMSMLLNAKQNAITTNSQV